MKSYFSAAAKHVADTVRASSRSEAENITAETDEAVKNGGLLLKIAAGLFTGSAIAGAAALYGHARAAQKIAQDAAHGIKSYQDIKHSSLTHALKQYTISSRVYIDEALSTDPMTVKILRSAYVNYAGMITAAMHLENFVTNCTTVFDRLSSVSTAALEAYVDVGDDLNTIAGLKYMMTSHSDLTEENAHLKKEVARLSKGKGGKREVHSLSANDVNIPSPDVFPNGSVFNVTLTNPTDPSASQTVPLSVNMRPYVLSADALTAVIEHSTPVPFGFRKLQATAGEIHWLKDLVFQCDRIKRLRTAHHNDRDGGFQKYLSEVAKKDRFKLGSILLANHSRSISKNTASTVLIIAQETLDMIQAQTGVDLGKKEVRERFMRESYTMMIYAVSQTYNKVRLYMNGVDDVSEYPIDAFNSAKSNNGSDITKILGFLAQGRAPRF